MTRTHFAMQRLLSLGALAPLLAAVGCSHAPAYSVLGSFFPVWMFCGLAGVLLAFAVHAILRRFDLHEQLSPPLLVYTSLAAAFCLALWLIFFS